MNKTRSNREKEKVHFHFFFCIIYSYEIRLSTARLQFLHNCKHFFLWSFLANLSPPFGRPQLHSVPVSFSIYFHTYSHSPFKQVSPLLKKDKQKYKTNKIKELKIERNKKGKRQVESWDSLTLRQVTLKAATKALLILFP